MRVVVCALAMVLVALEPNSATAQTLPQLHGGSARAQVESVSAGYFKYQYRLGAQPSESLSIVEFALDAGQGAGRALLSRDGLPSEAPMVLPTTRKEREEIVDKAVALSISGIPPEWSAGVDPKLRVRWGSNVASSQLTAGGQLVGFEISSLALPGVREARLEPDLDNYLPNVEEDPSAEAMYDQVPASAQILKTIGPVAPPEPFTPRAFADEIETMLNEARIQGWIATDAAKNSLADKLSDLKAALDASEFDDARSIASSFISEVYLTGCGVFSCGGSQLLTSEAYALLRFNMEYLRDRIPTTIRTTAIESDEDMDAFIVDEVFRAEGRIGDQAGTTSKELSLVQDFGGPERSAQFAWPSGVVVPFVFSFDGRAAKLDVGGGGRSLRTESLVFPLTVLPENLFVRAGAQAADSSISVTNLVLDGEPIADSVVADSAAGGLAILRIQASELNDGFSLAGNVTMSWSGTQPSESELSLQLRAVDAIAEPD